MYTKENPSQDREAVQAPLRLWRHLFAPERGLLHVFTGVRQGGKLTKVKGANFNYPEAAEAAARWALEKSEEGRETYFCAHLLVGPRRNKENAASVRALYGELDGAAPPNGEFKPSALVESSPGHYHVYWRLGSAILPAAAEKLNKALAREIGADPSGFDLSQLLRLPQSRNFKYAERPVVRLLELDGSREYVARDLEERLQPSEATSEATDAPKTEDEEDEPPVRLGGAGLRRWRGEVVERDEAGELDRSRSLLQIARMLAYAGATKRTIVEALRDRDVTLKWLKYATRNDGGKKAYVDLADGVCGPFEGDGSFDSSFSSFRSPMGKGDDDENNEAEIRWFHELGTPPEREYVIEKVGVKGYPIVAFGAGGVAKSFTMLAAGIAIASVSGVKEWLGLRILKHGYVLFVDLELDLNEQHRRVRDLCNGMGVPTPRRLAYLSGVGLDTPAVFARVYDFVRKYEPVAVIIDSTGMALVGDMDRAKDVIAFYKRYIEPLRQMGVTPLLVDHEGKRQAGERPRDKSPIGSVYKTNNSRSVLQFVLEAYDEEDSALDIRVNQHKTNFAPVKPFGVRITFAHENVSITTRELPAEELIDEDRLPVRDRILAALRIEPMTVSEIETQTGASKGTIYNQLSALMAEELVIQEGYRGRKKLYGLFSSSSQPPRGE